MSLPSSHAVRPLALVAGGMVLAVAACGGADQSPTSGGPTSVSTSVSTSAVAPSSAGASTSSATASTTPSPSSAASGGSGCAVASIKITYANDAGGGGAGSVSGELTFTNTGSTPCTLTGFPGVAFVGGGNGTQVGEPATRTDGAVKKKTLAPGKSVTAALRRTEPGMYGDDCHQTKVDGFRVYPPASTESAFVAFKTTGCKSTTVPLLQVGPVR